VFNATPSTSFHGKPGQAAFEALVENADDARVSKPREGMNLPAQTREHRLVGAEHRLDGRSLAGLQVPGPIDDSHAASTQDFDDLVRPDHAGLLTMAHDRSRLLGPDVLLAVSRGAAPGIL
jgi:hypothetical protein